MSSFNARLHMPGQTRLPLSVMVDIADERLTLTAGQRNVADWPIGEVSVSQRPDGLHLVFEHEEIVLNSDDPERLVRELTIADVESMPERRAAVGPSQTPVVNPSSLTDLRIEELRGQIAGVAEALRSNVMSPQAAFARWLRTAKDLNRRHGNGSIPSHVFYELNSQLLDLIPEPASEPV